MTNPTDKNVQANNEQTEEELELEVKRVKSLSTNVKGGIGHGGLGPSDGEGLGGGSSFPQCRLHLLKPSRETLAPNDPVSCVRTTGSVSFWLTECAMDVASNRATCPSRVAKM